MSHFCELGLLGPQFAVQTCYNARGAAPQDYRVHIKHTDGHFEYVPYFSLPANDLNDVIADSCYSCFDYPNYLADLVVGYMGVPYQNTDMTSHQ